MTDTEMLNLVNAVIRERLTGQATEGFNVRSKSWQGTPLSELYKMRKNLQDAIAAQNGNDGCLSLIDPIGD